MDQKNIAIGADVGGSHISCAAVDIQAGRIIDGSASREKVDNTAEAGLILGAWARALNASLRAIDTARLAGIGFAIPGPFDYRQGISRMEHKFAALHGLFIPGALRPLLDVEGDCPMRFLNDATSFAVGEAWLGQGRGAGKVLAITLGTGFGSAFIDGGVPVVAREDVPPEGCLWHLPYDQGIADEYFTTRWFVAACREATGRVVDGARDVALLAATDPAAREIFRRYGENMAAFLSPWLRAFRPEVIVIGGNIAGAIDLFGTSLREALAREDLGAVRIELSSLREDAAMIGAARLLDDAFWAAVSRQLPSI